MTHVSPIDVLDELDEGTSGYVEVLDEESLTVEIARLKTGEADPKNYHTEDELYYIISGKGKIRVGDEVHSVEAGDAVFVEQGVEHDFFDVERDLVTLNIFAGSSVRSQVWTF